MKRVFLVFAVIITTVLLGSCMTAQPPIEEDLAPGDFFKNAQTASMEYKNYQQALLYYKTFIERYPDEQVLIIEAEYEIAFLYYKMGEYDTSVQLFNKLLEKYSQPEAAILPAWPEVLSKKLIEIIETESSAPENGDKISIEEE